MTIIETCSAIAPRPALPVLDAVSTACVPDPLHAVSGSWLGLVVQPIGPGEPAPQLSSVVRCEDARWRP